MSSSAPPAAPASPPAAIPASADNQIRSGKLAGRTLTGAMAIIAIPILLEQFANALVGTADLMLAGHLPEAISQAAVDGVGMASYVRWLIGICVSALGVGGAAMIARGIGSGDQATAGRALGQSMLFSILWGAIVGVVLWNCVDWMTNFINLSPAASDYCAQYIRITAIGTPVITLMFTTSMCMHGAGETTRPFLIMMVVNVINVGVSWMLAGVDFTFGETVWTNPFSFDMHVAGIAWGTVIAQTCGAAMLVALAVRGIDGLRLDLPALRPDFTMFWRIIRIGVPGFIEGMGMWLGQLFGILWIIGRIAEQSGQPEGLQGAHAIAIQFEAFSFMPGFALGIAAGTLAGQYLGAGNPRQAARAILACTGLAMALMSAMGVAFIIFGRPLTALISDSEVHLEYVPRLLIICGAVQIFFAMLMVMRQGLRGVGDTGITMAITWVSTFGVRIPLAWFIGLHLGHGLDGVWYGLCGEIIIRSLLFLARFLHGGWKTVKV